MARLAGEVEQDVPIANEIAEWVSETRASQGEAS